MSDWLGRLEQLRAEEIELLHAFNDIKDVCEALLGRMAEMRGESLAQVGKEFEEPDEEEIE